MKREPTPSTGGTLHVPRGSASARPQGHDQDSEPPPHGDAADRDKRLLSVADLQQAAEEGRKRSQ